MTSTRFHTVVIYMDQHPRLKHTPLSKHQKPRKLTLTLALLAIHTYFVLEINAAPWIDAGDERARHHIQILQDSGHLSIPSGTWPLPWNSVHNAMDDIDTTSLSEREVWSLRYLKHRIRQEKSRYTNHVRASATQSTALLDFASSTREELQLQNSTNLMTRHFALNITASRIANDTPENGRQQEERFDGSYIAGTWNNWILGFGAIDRWWGPTWQSSTILSNNARPTPGFFLQRKTHTASSLPILSWFGPWSLQAFVNNAKSSRDNNDSYLDDTYLLGARLSMQPHPRLSLNFHRTLMWQGSSDRSQLKILAKHIALQETSATQPEGSALNLAGFDWRINFNAGPSQIALYHQYTAKSRSDLKNLKGVFVWGTEINYNTRLTSNRLSLEYADTSSNPDKQHSSPTFFYDGPNNTQHAFNQRWIGASQGDDVRSITLLAQHYLSNGIQLHWKTGKLQPQASTQASPLESSIATRGTHTDNSINFASAGIKAPITNHLQLELGANFFSKTFTQNGTTADSGGFLAVQFAF